MKNEIFDWNSDERIPLVAKGEIKVVEKKVTQLQFGQDVLHYAFFFLLC